jgi:hypothetical protein
MIERLRSSLDAMQRLRGDALLSPASARLRGDCADALRLELDCPQQALSPHQRARLSRLSDLLEESAPSGAALEQAVREAWSAIT